MARDQQGKRTVKRRQYNEEFKEEAVRMLLDGHSATAVASNLGLGGTSLLYRWKAEQLRRGGQTASVLEVRVRELEAQLRCVERERDILKKALAIFSQRA